MNHFQHLSRQIPDLRSRRILDVGSGRGAFLIAAAREGVHAQGIEYNPLNVLRTKDQAQEIGATVSVIQGVAEALPYPDAAFDFINVCEVLEHVADPHLVMKEVMRVLVPNGLVYVSIPNRYGFRDPHYLLYGINWLPRRVAEQVMRVLGLNKGHSKEDSGQQSLSEMHYMTKKQFEAFLSQYGLRFTDSREVWLRKQWYGPLALPVFHLYAWCILATYHGVAVRT